MEPVWYEELEARLTENLTNIQVNRCVRPSSCPYLREAEDSTTLLFMCWILIELLKKML